MGAPEGVARADDAVKGPVVEGFRRPPRCPIGSPMPPTVSRGRPARIALDRDRELDEAAAAERVAEAPFPADERTIPETPAAAAADLHPPGLEGARPVALAPHPAPATGGGHAFQARGRIPTRRCDWR